MISWFYKNLISGVRFGSKEFLQCSLWIVKGKGCSNETIPYKYWIVNQALWRKSLLIGIQAINIVNIENWKRNGCVRVKYTDCDVVHFCLDYMDPIPNVQPKMKSSASLHTINIDSISTLNSQIFDLDSMCDTKPMRTHLLTRTYAQVVTSMQWSDWINIDCMQRHTDKSIIWNQLTNADKKFFLSRFPPRNFPKDSHFCSRSKYALSQCNNAEFNLGKPGIDAETCRKYHLVPCFCYTRLSMYNIRRNQTKRSNKNINK